MRPLLRLEFGLALLARKRTSHKKMHGSSGTDLRPRDRLAERKTTL